jgi:hypothetical protein
MSLKFCAFSGAVLLLFALKVLVNAQYRVEKGITNKSLTGYAFHNFTVASIVDCFIACVKDCLCRSFQLYKNTQCQLLASNQYQSPAAFVDMTGYVYYDMVPPTLKQVKIGQFIIITHWLCQQTVYKKPIQFQPVIF